MAVGNVGCKGGAGLDVGEGPTEIILRGLAQLRDSLLEGFISGTFLQALINCGCHSEHIHIHSPARYFGQQRNALETANLHP